MNSRPMTAIAEPRARPVLSVRRLRVHYPGHRWWPWPRGTPVRAVDDVQFDLQPGETVGIVGEPGCGKSSLARALVGLAPVSAGQIAVEGEDVTRADPAGWRRARRQVQWVPQNPLANLGWRTRLVDTVTQPLKRLCPEVAAEERHARALEALSRVGLSAHARSLPRKLSAEQRRLGGLAQALVLRPRVLICDEWLPPPEAPAHGPFVNLLATLQAEHGLAMIVIARDPRTVRTVCGRVLVMCLGKVMEQARSDALFEHPRHPYTRDLLGRALLGAVPPGGNHPPAPAFAPSGCVYRTRCWLADAICAREVPALRRIADGSHAACHFAGAAESLKG